MVLECYLNYTAIVMEEKVMQNNAVEIYTDYFTEVRHNPFPVIVSAFKNYGSILIRFQSISYCSYDLMPCVLPIGNGLSRLKFYSILLI